MKESIKGMSILKRIKISTDVPIGVNRKQTSSSSFEVLCALPVCTLSHPTWRYQPDFTLIISLLFLVVVLSCYPLTIRLFLPVFECFRDKIILYAFPSDFLL